MSEVPRYMIDREGDPYERRNGDWVEYGECARIINQRDALRAEVEQLRVQLAACGVAAMCDTEESRIQAYVERGAYGWSDSYDQVLKAVGRELALRAEVARLSAACAAKDAALSKALGYVDLDNDALISKCLAALKGTAGRNYIDATGAVEDRVYECTDSQIIGDEVHTFATLHVRLPCDWAGASVKIVRVKP